MSFRFISLAVLAPLLLLPSGTEMRAEDSLWIQVPIQTNESRKAGNWGGEGCQVISNFACDSTGTFVIFGTDVGGLYRSTNGGQRWEPMNVGYKPRGSAFVAVDPVNAQRMLSVGANAARRDPWHGLWLSIDGGDTWASVLPKDNDLDSGPGGRGSGQLAYDPSSARNGSCQVAYWATPGNIKEGEAGLWKTEDGGLTWKHLNPEYSGAWLAMHPNNGTLYAGNGVGLFKSTDGGKTFSSILEGAIRGLATSAAEPELILALRQMDLEKSTDGGSTWKTLADAKNGRGLPTTQWANGPGWFRITVSPVNPKLMQLINDTGNWTDQPAFYSRDGGKSWAQPVIDRKHAFIQPNVRGQRALFHPSDDSIIWANVGDMAFQSKDSGKSFHWFNNGYTGYTFASICNFNVKDPNIFLVTSQDYQSALTLDGGERWKYLDPSHTNNPDGTPGWGGWQYSGYAFNAKNMFAGRADSWSAPRLIAVSSDGGNQFQDSGAVRGESGKDVSLGDPRDPQVAFYGNLRTQDEGKTWKPMLNPEGGGSSCEGVFTYDADPKGEQALYGSINSTVVKSTDHGVTWTSVHQFGGVSWLTDVAYDWKNRRVYACTDLNQLVAYDIDSGQEDHVASRLLRDNNGAQMARTVCIDPVDPDVVYCGNHADVYMSDTAVQRSTDGGKTWVNLTKQPGQKGLDGGREAYGVRVRPDTRELWVGGECYGLWKYPPPPAQTEAVK